MIRKLPTNVINQIAAGEVVERPASVVKELLENSLDAGATRVRVEVQGGGAELVCIVDDGEGFLPEDLPLAFASHATSKLASVEDLDHIGSLGFRGEALASIGAVSRALVKSRRHGAHEGWELRCDGGAESAPQPCGCPEGTRIEVRDLFFNVPARRRFLKSPGAERARIQELVAQLSLARLDVDVTFVADGKDYLRLPAGESLAARFRRCFGQELGSGLIEVSRTFPGLVVEGVIAEPDLARRDGRLELMYANGRLARESAVLHATRQAYREYLMGGRFPVYVLNLTMPPDQVDANVHPRKAEVRFVESRRVAGCVHEAVRSALSGRTASAGSAGGVVLDPAMPRARSGFPELPRSLFEVEPSVVSPMRELAGSVVREPSVPKSPVVAARPAESAGLPNPFRRVSGRFLQVLDLYLVLEGPEGLLVVDQHALHERVVYEQLRAQHRDRAVRSQRLLTPVVVEVTPAEHAFVESVQAELAAEGFVVEPFGPATVAVQAVPAVLTRVDCVRLLRDLLAGEASGDARVALREQIAERFHSMACRSAVMSGDRLGDEEVRALLLAASSLEHPHNCPHGRPTVLSFGSAELERYFRRRC